ncbi:hypothetical protein [Rhizobium sp. BK491]|uniref:hypothetical protein n=1 Tax=Rhizobium sp. BK491 TaxID=2587009 RepID=UPI0017A6F65B|nr:hypothetical protein [Rhizobium sp. BK491]MBB3571032.1 hypothetical protein [Rhizobium sp. BK491]
MRDQYKTQADLQAAQATMAGLVGDIATDLYAKATSQAERDLWKEGGEGRVLLRAIGAGILGGVNGWEGAVKGALGGAATTLMAPAIANLVKGMLKDSTLSDQNKQTLATLIGTSLSSAVGTVAGGGEGGSYGAANYQFNYLTHAQREEQISKLRSCNGDQNCVEKIVDEYRDLNISQENQLITCQTRACVDAVVASLKDSAATLGKDYLELLGYSSEAADLAVAYQQIGVFGSQLKADIDYAYFTANYCEQNPGSSCKRDGGVVYFGSQLALEATYGALGIAKIKVGSGSNAEGEIVTGCPGGRCTSAIDDVALIAEDDAAALAKGDASAGSVAHKQQRWDEYQERGGTWNYSQWSNVYDANMTRATAANDAVRAYRDALGWGKTEVTVNANIGGQQYARRLDIADIEDQRGIELKTGYQSATQANLWEVARDKALVDSGWDVKWVFQGSASGALKQALKDANIPFEGGN